MWGTALFGAALFLFVLTRPHEPGHPPGKPSAAVSSGPLLPSGTWSDLTGGASASGDGIPRPSGTAREEPPGLRRIRNALDRLPAHSAGEPPTLTDQRRALGAILNNYERYGKKTYSGPLPPDRRAHLEEVREELRNWIADSPPNRYAFLLLSSICQDLGDTECVRDARAESRRLARQEPDAGE